MLLSLALIGSIGLIAGYACDRIKLPKLFGIIMTGMMLGPHFLNLTDPRILAISDELREIALIIILTRAGLNLNISDLIKVGRPALMMCFVPATFEICGMAILAPTILGLSAAEGALLGAITAAVSPAVVVPKMISLQENGWGTNKKIPQMIMTGASADDVYVIVLFASFASIVKGGHADPTALTEIPVSIISGIAAGAVLGFMLARAFKKIQIRDSEKIIIMLSLSFALIAIEQALRGYFSGLLAVIGMSCVFHINKPDAAKRISDKYSKLWVAELMLFWLVGCSIDLTYASEFGISAAMLVFGALLFRMTGVFLCVTGTNLNIKEKFFCMAAYIPKATVQAVLGGLPLSMGLACGNAALTVAVVAILITAPLGAFSIDILYKKCLKCEKP
ncbi:MAG: cation:proton antiporter [bacterium]|nr:cation:proton antiporter [bacterium]